MPNNATKKKERHTHYSYINYDDDTNNNVVVVSSWSKIK